MGDKCHGFYNFKNNTHSFFSITMALALPSSNLISLVLRGVQLFLTVLNLGLSAGVIGDISGYYGRAVYVLIITLFTLIYLVFTLFKPALKLLPSLASLIIESVFFVFWLAAFAVIADDIGSLDCSFTSYYGYTYDFSWCKVGKALIAFSVLEWISFIISLVLLIVYTIVPLTRAGGFNDLLIRDIFTLGGIYMNGTDSTGAKGATTDLEKGAEPAEGAEGAEDTETAANQPPLADEGVTINDSIDANHKIEEDSLERRPSDD